MIQVVPYTNPDIDGFACTLAYAEFLNLKNEKAQALIFGQPRQETEFVINFLNLEYLSGENLFEKDEKVAIVDASDTKWIYNKIDAKDVIEVIDHRICNESENFPNAKIQIELIGAAATLIAERFYLENIKPSYKSAILLYSAIVWNTINFRNKVTTEKDVKMAEWLKMDLNLPVDYEKKFFTSASKLDETNFDFYFAEFEIQNVKIGIGQLEIVDVEEFVKRNFEKIKVKVESSKENFDLLFLTCIDLDLGFNLFVAFDKNTQQILENIFDVKFENNIAKRQGIVMRKEIAPLLKDYLS